MRTNIINRQQGQVSKVILAMAAVVLIIIAIVFIALKIAGGKKTASNAQNQQEQAGPPAPIYQAKAGDIDFTLQSSVDMGNIIKSTTTYQTSLTTTERFIKVIVAAQNEGKSATDQFSWQLGNIIDSDGRVFASINNKAYYFLPTPDTCGAVLQPAFQPTPCVGLYEVSKQSKGLKIQVINKSVKQGTVLLDLRLP